jgi:hypothetical protein
VSDDVDRADSGAQGVGSTARSPGLHRFVLTPLHSDHFDRAFALLHFTLRPRGPVPGVLVNGMFSVRLIRSRASGGFPYHGSKKMLLPAASRILARRNGRGTIQVGRRDGT